MDAGIAALVGATVGSLGALGAAAVGARAQARTQHAQWRRQHRRDAYARYLGVLHDRDVAMDAILDALRADQPDLAEVDEKVRHFIALAREVHRVAEVVILEGPPAVAEAADHIAQASAALSEVMRRMVENAHELNTASRTQDFADADARERELYQVITGFRVKAREVLGNAD